MKLLEIVRTPPIVAISVALLALTGAAAPKVVYVAPDGTGDGSSWDAPTANVANAYAAAAAFAESGCDSGEVWMKAGRYVFSSAVKMKPGVTVVGGFAAFTAETTKDDSTPDVTPTVITGDKNGDDVWRPNNEPSEVALPIWSGDDMLTYNPPTPGDDVDFWAPHYGGTDVSHAFEVEAGNQCVGTDFRGITFTCFYYAAIHVSATGATYLGTISRCRFLACGTNWRNWADGGTSILVKNGQATVEDCEFDGNCSAMYFATTEAGFVDRRSDGRVATIRRCLFTHHGLGGICLNDTPIAEGFASWEVSDCVFERNHASWDQKACITHTGTGRAHLAVSSCLFAGNRIREEGDGVICDRSGYGTHNVTFEMTGCVFSNNVCSIEKANDSISAGLYMNSAGTFNGEIRDCAFLDSVATCGGAGSLAATAAVTGGPNTDYHFLNCTFDGNSASATVPGSYAMTLGGAVGSNADFYLVNDVFCNNSFACVDGATSSEVMFVKVSVAGVNLQCYNTILNSKAPDYVPFRSIMAATGGRGTSCRFYWCSVTGFNPEAFGDTTCTTHGEIDSTNDPLLSGRLAGPDGRIAVGVTKDSPFRKTGHAIWRLSPFQAYVYDPENPFATGKPWYDIRARSAMSDADAAALGLTLETPLLPDAFGNPRTLGKVAYGPLNAPVPGLMLLLR